MQIGDYWLQLDLAQKTYLRLPATKEEEEGFATIVDSGEEPYPPPNSSGTISPEAETEMYPKSPVEPEKQAVPQVLPAPAMYDLEVVPSKQMNVTVARFNIALRNFGPKPLLVNLEAFGTDENLRYTIDRTQVELPVNEGYGRKEVPFSVRLGTPTGGDRPCSHSFTIRAYPVDQPENARLVSAEWVQTVPEISLQLTPTSSQADDRRSFNLIVKNNSAEDLTVQWVPGDPQNALSYEIQPEQQHIRAGEETLTPMKVKQKQPISSPANAAYSFVIAAKVLEAPAYTQQIQGEWGKIPATPLIIKDKFLAPPYLWAWILLILGWSAPPILLEIVRKFICEDCIKDWAFSIGMEEGSVFLLLILISILFMSLVSGLMTGISLRLANHSLSIGGIIIITLTWVFSISGILTCSTELFFGLPWVLYLIQGAVGGLITGLVLMRMRVNPINISQALSVMVAWGITRGLGVWILDRIETYYIGEIWQEVFLGAFCAIIAGGWTLYVMFRSQTRGQSLQP